METTNNTQLPTPPGYEALIPFDKESHRSLGVKTEGRFAFASSLHAIYLSSVEFLQAARHYPIVFSANSDESMVVPMAVTGLKPNQNLFLKEDGSWMDGVYVPAYLRRYPFYTAQVRRGDETHEHMICVDPSGLSEGPTPLMDAEGNVSEEWKRLENFIREMEIARQRTEFFTNALKEHDLLENFEATVHGRPGEDLKVGGMQRVNEEKLRKLPGEALQTLMANDYLYLIDLHRMSLDNFRLLLERSAEQTPAS